MGILTWRMSDCEELVGIIHRGMILKENCQREKSYYRENVTPLRVFDVPEVLEVHVVPLSEEVRIVPESPNVTKELFPKEIPLRPFDVPEVLLSQEVPSEEVRMVPE